MAAHNAFQPTQEQRRMVHAMTGYGMPQEDICRTIVNPKTQKPVDLKTLRKCFRSELDTGVVIANSKVAENLYKLATGTGPGAVAASIFWMKTRAGWKDTSYVNNTITTKQLPSSVDEFV